MPKPAVTWAVVLGGLAVLDLWCDSRKNESTLSCVTRRLVDSIPHGEQIFTVSLICSGLWFHDHILSPLAAASLAAVEPPAPPR